MTTLPKLTYSTDPGSFVSSHSMQLRSWSSRLLLSPLLVSLWRGPMAKTGMVAPSSSRTERSSGVSRASNVFTTVPEEFVVVSVERARILLAISSLKYLLGSNRSDTRSGGISSTGLFSSDSETKQNK
ncbi:Os07g0241751, partial [Oryza sativa Japonica Group]